MFGDGRPNNTRLLGIILKSHSSNVRKQELGEDPIWVPAFVHPSMLSETIVNYGFEDTWNHPCSVAVTQTMGAVTRKSEVNSIAKEKSSAEVEASPAGNPTAEPRILSPQLFPAGLFNVGCVIFRWSCLYLVPTLASNTCLFDVWASHSQAKQAFQGAQTASPQEHARPVSPNQNDSSACSAQSQTSSDTPIMSRREMTDAAAELRHVYTQPSFTASTMKSMRLSGNP